MRILFNIVILLAAVGLGTSFRNGEVKSETLSASADSAQMKAGQAIFSDSCTGCHQTNGEGVPRMFPPLKKNVLSPDPTSIVQIILDGAPKASRDTRPAPVSMPAYGWKLNDEQAAAVATYIRNSWGNSAPVVTADQVRSIRDRLDVKIQ